MESVDVKESRDLPQHDYHGNCYDDCAGFVEYLRRNAPPLLEQLVDQPAHNHERKAENPHGET